MNNRPLIIVLMWAIAIIGGVNFGLTLIKVWKLEEQNALLRVNSRCLGRQILELETGQKMVDRHEH